MCVCYIYIKTEREREAYDTSIAVLKNKKGASSRSETVRNS